MTDDDEVTRQAGARLACLAAFTHPNAEDLAENAASGDAILRLGAAQVYARNLANPRLEERCLARLRFVSNEDPLLVDEIKRYIEKSGPRF